MAPPDPARPVPAAVAGVTPVAQHEADRYSLSLLDHDGLMTPVLQAAFGPLQAIQQSAHQEGPVFLRRSSIVRVPGGEMILSAALEIQLAALPAGFLPALLSGTTLFGQVLRDFGIPVMTRDRQVYRQDTDAGSHARWGRRLGILRAQDAALLCRVDELLAPGDALLGYRRASDA
jgi:hypothetical protein